MRIACCRLLVVFGCLVAAVGVPSAALAKSSRRLPAAAVSNWSQPQVLGLDGGKGQLGGSLGIAADGGSLIVWMRQGVRARWRDANGRLGPEELISPPDQSSQANDGRVTMAADGTAVVFWTVPSAGNSLPTRYARTRSRDGHLGPVQNLTALLDDGWLQGVFFGPSDGQPRVIWTQQNEPLHPRTTGLFIGTLDLSGGKVTSSVALDDPTLDAANPSMANLTVALDVDEAGNSFLVWVDQPHNQVWGRVLNRDGNLEPMLRISAGGTPVSPLTLPRVSLSPGGVGHVLWSEGSYLPQTLQARPVDVHGNLGSIATVGRLTQLSSSFAADLATFADGRSLVVWSGETQDLVLLGRVVSRTGAGRRMRLSGPAKQEVAVDPRVVAQGTRATVVWSYGDVRRTSQGTVLEPHRFGLRSRSVSVSGRRGTPSDVFKAELGLFHRGAGVAGNAAGQVVVLWQAQNYRFGQRGDVVLVAGQRQQPTRATAVRDNPGIRATATALTPWGQEYDSRFLAQGCVDEVLGIDSGSFRNGEFRIYTGGSSDHPAIGIRRRSSISIEVSVNPMISGLLSPEGVRFPCPAPAGETIETRLLFQDIRLVKRRIKPNVVRTKLVKRWVPASPWVPAIQDSAGGAPPMPADRANDWQNPGLETLTYSLPRPYTCVGPTIRRLLLRELRKQGVLHPRGVGRGIAFQISTTAHSGSVVEHTTRIEQAYLLVRDIC